jgi:predicted enzyme related to lactoylglutathione lyase
MQVEGITWHALTLKADEFDPTKKLLIEVFGLRPAIDEDDWTMFPMSNGTILELYAPGAIPAYGFNDGGIVFGFRVDDIEAASEELAEAGCELLGEITRNEEMNYAYRDFKGPDGRVYGINERKKLPRVSFALDHPPTVGCGLELPSCAV